MQIIRDYKDQYFHIKMGSGLGAGYFLFVLDPFLSFSSQSMFSHVLLYQVVDRLANQRHWQIENGKRIQNISSSSF